MAGMRTESMRMTMNQILCVKYRRIAPAIEAAWREEIHRRIADLESGRVPAIPLRETLAKAWAIAGMSGDSPLVS